MLDSKIRPYVDRPLKHLAQWTFGKGISANALTAIGFGFAICVFASLAFQAYYLAIVFILFNRLIDGLDGLVARLSKPTDIGGFFDIVSDFIFYAGSVFFFALGRPEESLSAAFLLFSFMGTSSSFLAYAIMAAKNRIKEEKKSFYYLTGLTEGTETIFMLLLMCLIPQHFMYISLIFGALCWVTTYGRVRQAYRDFS